MATARKPTLRGRRLVRALWQIVRIYWTSPDAKWGALLLGGAVALEFGVVQTSLFVSDAQRRTVEALEGRDAGAFLFMVGLFVGLSLLLILAAEHSFDDAQVREALSLVGLERFADRLDEVAPWDQQLSAHEQQLLAISRALLQEPDWLLLDEATSGIDEPAERRIYDTLLARLPRTGVIAAGLRPQATLLMQRRWTLAERDGARVLLAA